MTKEPSQSDVLDSDDAKSIISLEDDNFDTSIFV